MTTPAKINKELKKMGIDGKIVRNAHAGYYYFIGCLFDVVPSVYDFNLKGWSTEEMINYINKYYKK